MFLLRFLNKIITETLQISTFKNQRPKILESNPTSSSSNREKDVQEEAENANMDPSYVTLITLVVVLLFGLVVAYFYLKVHSRDLEDRFLQRLDVTISNNQRAIVHALSTLPLVRLAQATSETPLPPQSEESDPLLETEKAILNKNTLKNRIAELEDKVSTLTRSQERASIAQEILLKELATSKKKSKPTK